MENLTMELLNAKTDKDYIEGYCLVQSYKIDKTKNGDDYINGTLMAKGSIPFKAWNNSSAFPEFKNYNYNGQVVSVVGTVNVYNGQKSIIVSNVTAINDIKAETFLEDKYDITYYTSVLHKLIEKYCTANGVELVNKVLFNNTEVFERFKMEFAASSHHDNCKGGLIAHTVKVVNAMAYIINMYPDLVKGKDDAETSKNIDLLIIGSALHDIGKIDEMNFGGYTEISRVTHRFLGIEHIMEFKSWIIETFGNIWYYNLVSVFLQHHNEFDDKARTVWAYLIHKADLLDSEMTFITQLKADSDGTKIKLNGRYLEF